MRPLSPYVHASLSQVRRLIKREVVSGVRTLHADVSDEQTWSSLEPLRACCALVTCVHMLSRRGGTHPTLWQPSLKLASQMLVAGGIYMQYDTDKWGGFADQQAMQRFAEAHHLAFVARAEPVPCASETDGRFFAVLFRKVEPGSAPRATEGMSQAASGVLI